MIRRSVLALGLATFFVLARQHSAAAQSVGPSPWPSATAITVRPGDNLYRIALRYGTTVETLTRTNQLTSANRILVGQRLHVPLGEASGAPPAAGPAVGAVGRPVGGTANDAVGGAVGDTSPSAVVEVNSEPSPEGRPGQYIVQPGDNLYRIALRHGTSVAAIMTQNGLTAPDYVAAGQVLRLPGGSADAGIGIGGAPVAPAAAPHAGGGGSESDGGMAGAVGGPAAEASTPEVATSGAAAPAPIAPAPDAPVPAAANRAWRSIVIDLSDQTLTAYEGGAAIRHFVVSTGKPATPTPIGHYAIYSRYRSQDMSGPGYWAPGVPFVQYFIGGYALHGTYWHTAFGTPVSHGCVNLQTPDAEWLWGWATIGTPVTVQW